MNNSRINILRYLVNLLEDLKPKLLRKLSPNPFNILLSLVPLIGLILSVFFNVVQINENKSNVNKLGGLEATLQNIGYISQQIHSINWELRDSFKKAKISPLLLNQVDQTANKSILLSESISIAVGTALHYYFKNDTSFYKSYIYQENKGFNTDKRNDEYYQESINCYRKLLIEARNAEIAQDISLARQKYENAMMVIIMDNLDDKDQKNEISKIENRLEVLNKK